MTTRWHHEFMVLAYNIRRSISEKYLKGGDEVTVGQKFCKKYPRWQIVTYKRCCRDSVCLCDTNENKVG